MPGRGCEPEEEMMKLSRTSSVEELQVIGRFESLRKILLSDEYADHLISEETFHRILQTLRALHEDARVPQDVRRAVLEASVRATQDWHQNAVRAAFENGERSWRLTAVFCAIYVPGFD